ncbi:MAG: phosphoglucomutase/phosphomannomutase family protein [Anaerolineae bacterium]|nr:phosphoglucomutase/phosphomannomutase family protein [Anaerolineae bacterium]
MTTRIKFGTDGWRAIIAEDYTFENVRICAKATARYLHDTGMAGRGLVVGYDTRFQSERFAEAVATVVASEGIKAYLCDRPAPTPTISFSILDRQAAGAVVITASHNPGIWNGYKYKPEYAGSASPEVIAALEERIAAIQAEGRPVTPMPLQEALDKGLVELFDPEPAYMAQLHKLVDIQAIKDAGLKIVVDPMYGAGIDYFPKLLAGGRTQVIQVNGFRNPIFPGMHNPEPIDHNLHILRNAILEHRADVGLANDGDADRIGVMDERGVFINQLQVYALLLLYLLEVRGMRGPIVKTLTTTVMAYKLAEKYGLPVYETPVGFKYVGPKMLETDAIMGGEESGGFGFKGHIPERDGILAGLFILDLMVKLGKKPSELIEYLYAQVGPHYYDRIDVPFPPERRDEVVARVREAHPTQIAGLAVRSLDTTDGFRFHLEDGGWLLIRFSGTEPIIRVYTETTHQDKVQKILEEGLALAGLQAPRK